jgi:hsp70-interacting protein
MSSPHPSLRWRAGELAATCMANNPPVQRWFMEGGAAPALMALLSDPHPVVATKALLGLSALVRHYQPGLEVSGAGLPGWQQKGGRGGTVKVIAHPLLDC